MAESCGTNASPSKEKVEYVIWMIVRLNVVKWRLALKTRCLFNIFKTSHFTPSSANANVLNFTGITSPVVRPFWLHKQ